MKIMFILQYSYLVRYLVVVYPWYDTTIIWNMEPDRDFLISIMSLAARQVSVYDYS